MAKDKNRPQEVSSKQPVSVARNVAPYSRPKAHDPRFDRAMGNFNPDLFEKTFSFVKDIQRAERQKIDKAIETEKDPRRVDDLKKMSQRLRSMEESKKREEARKKILRERKKVEAELIAQGKQPFYLKKADVKKLELMEKFKEIKAKAKGGEVDIDKLVEKRRKHKASKQHKFMPNI